MREWVGRESLVNPCMSLATTASIAQFHSVVGNWLLVSTDNSLKARL